MFESFHTAIETARASGVDGLASIFICIQLSFVGTGLAIHRGAICLHYVRHRFRREADTIPVRKVRLVPASTVDRRFSRVRRRRA